MGAGRLHVNTPRVVHETIDGEVVVIDLATGTYFSLQGGAANVWALISAGKPRAEMVAILSDLYGENPDSIRSELESFLAQLQAELLVVASNGQVGSHEMPELRATGAFSTHLEKHTDMKELILLDPVHDVDSVGWPHLPEGHEAHETQTS